MTLLDFSLHPSKQAHSPVIGRHYLEDNKQREGHHGTFKCLGRKCCGMRSSDDHQKQNLMILPFINPMTDRPEKGEVLGQSVSLN